MLADRQEPAGATIALLVARVPPPAGPTSPGTGTSFGFNFGDAEPLSGAIAAGTSRMGRTSLQLEWRGSGPHTSTSLACPEADPLGAQAASRPHDDPALQDAFVAAVGACAARLRADGIDPGDYTSTAMAQDVEDLRVAADVDTWAMAGSYGTQSAVLLEYLRLHPGRVQAAYMDSPSFASPDGFHGGAAALQETLDVLFDTCEQSPACRADHPDLRRSWDRALDLLTTTPLTGTATVAGQEVDVLVDAPKLVRAVRFALGGEGGPLPALPRIITEAAHGRMAPELAQAVAEDPIFCSGYRPLCHDRRFSLGAFLTNLCSAPPAPEPHVAEASPGTKTKLAHPAIAAVFDDSPYEPACQAWGTPPAKAPPRDDSVDIPLLLMSGALNSFSPPEATRTAASQLGPMAYLLDVPGGSHNVLGFFECAISARNEWSKRPERPPRADACDDTQYAPAP
ncbi:alpha/beta hydrolase [Ornithinimicrobium sp. LYQ103]|uniref:alpha/beta hydrolase n=1 Tax=Ornithinimicrobium sp. LYQ103 TaxID=3378796 RepID=UPI003853BD08